MATRMTETTATIGPTDQVLPLREPDRFDLYDIVVLNDEELCFVVGPGPRVVRGVCGTTPSGHSFGTTAALRGSAKPQGWRKRGH